MAELLSEHDFKDWYDRQDSTLKKGEYELGARGGFRVFDIFIKNA
jgi:hypothetical protein